MKFYFALFGLASLFAFTAAISDERKEIMRKIHKECLDDSKVDLALVQNVRQGDFSSKDEKLQRYMWCISRKNNLVTSEGELDLDEIVSKISNDPEKTKAVIAACERGLGTSALESVWKIAKCLHGNITPNANPDHP